MDNNYIPEDDFDSIPDLEQSDFENQIENNEVEIENEASQLASTPGKNILIIGILTIASIAFLYNMVFKEDEKAKEQKALEKIIESQPVEKAIEATKPSETLQADIGVVETPELPDIEGLQALPTPSLMEEAEIAFPKDSFGGFEPEPEPEPEPAKVEPQTVRIVEPAVEPVIEQEQAPPPRLLMPQGPTPLEIAARKAEKRRSGMLVMNGGGMPSESAVSAQGNIGGTGETAEGDIGSTRSSKEPATLSRTSAAQVVATDVGNTDRMIIQGKVISAVLETAINTDLEGMLRAVISRDIYAESGKNILIPRGSRLIGSYASGIEKGQERIAVSWQRIIRPDGVDIAVDSPGTDQLGRAGMTGIVDNKYFEILSHSILLSALTIGGTIIVDGIEKSQGASSSTTTAVDGASTSTQTGTPTDFAVMESVTNLGSVVDKFAEGLINEQPTIVVQQGARIKVFVNKDLIFPASSINKVKFIN